LPESIRQDKPNKALNSALLVSGIFMTIGRPPNEGESETFKITIPKPLYESLVYLARNTHVGSSVSEVASFLLKERISQMVVLKIPDA
jgi:hypothetical protein